MYHKNKESLKKTCPLAPILIPDILNSVLEFFYSSVFKGEINFEVLLEEL